MMTYKNFDLGYSYTALNVDC